MPGHDELTSALFAVQPIRPLRRQAASLHDAGGAWRRRIQKEVLHTGMTTPWGRCCPRARSRPHRPARQRSAEGGTAHWRAQSRSISSSQSVAGAGARLRAMCQQCRAVWLIVAAPVKPKSKSTTCAHGAHECRKLRRRLTLARLCARVSKSERLSTRTRVSALAVPSALPTLVSRPSARRPRRGPQSR